MSVVYRTPFNLSYIDFRPRCLGVGEAICSPEYERFDVLIDRANQWLRSNGQFKVKTCESIEVKGRYDGVVDTNKSCYFEADATRRRMRNLYIRALRLWVLPKTSMDSPDSQQVSYINIVPARNEQGGFDDFGETIRKFNAHLRRNPLPGKILNVETQEMKFHEWGVGVDPDESCWVESVRFNISYLIVVRVFYELGPSAFEEIGCADFVPNCLEKGSQFGSLSYECFGTVLAKASHWLRVQEDIHVTNIQSIDYKLHLGSEGEVVDSKRSFFVESGRFMTRYLRILRICFVKSFAEPESPTVGERLLLSYVTFQPVMISTGGIMGMPIFESMTDTMRRLMLWLNKHPELQIVSAETVPVRMFTGNQYGNHEITYTWNRGEQKEVWLLVLRIFLNGIYSDPPPDMLVPISTKDIKPSACCTLQ